MIHRGRFGGEPMVSWSARNTHYPRRLTTHVRGTPGTPGSLVIWWDQDAQMQTSGARFSIAEWVPPVIHMSSDHKIRLQSTMPRDGGYRTLCPCGRTLWTDFFARTRGSETLVYHNVTWFTVILPT